MSGINRWRIGMGPVFVYERIAASRRWQGYALRALFLLTLLVALLLVWEKASRAIGISPIRFYGQAARDIFFGVVGTELRTARTENSGTLIRRPVLAQLITGNE
jgi:hypothetical protein